MSWLTLPKIRDQSGEEIDGGGQYMVIDPDDLYRGKSYGEWATDWLNWFLSKDADRRNSGPVVFLRSKGLPNEKTGANISDVPGLPAGDRTSETPLDSMETDVTGLSGYSKSYVNDPNVRIGGDRLQIYEDQAVFVPVIVAFWLKTSPYADWGSMSDATGLTIDYGDNPPGSDQLTINQEEIILPPPRDNDDLKTKLDKLVATREKNLKEALKVKAQAIETLKKTREEAMERVMANKAKATKSLLTNMERAVSELMVMGERSSNGKLAPEGTPANDYTQLLASDKSFAELNVVFERMKTDLDEGIRNAKSENDKTWKDFAKNKLEDGKSLMKRFRIATKVFTAIVPESQYGLSAKDFIEEAPVAPNNYPAMVDGYFVMLKFKPGTYWIHSWASAPREARGPYFSELLYQVQVLRKDLPANIASGWRPARNERILNQILEQKKSEGDLTKSELNRLKMYFATSGEPERKPLIQRDQ